MGNASMVLVLGTSGEAKSLEKGWSREMGSLEAEVRPVCLVDGIQLLQGPWQSWEVICDG